MALNYIHAVFKIHFLSLDLKNYISILNCGSEKVAFLIYCFEK